MTLPIPLTAALGALASVVLIAAFVVLVLAVALVAAGVVMLRRVAS